jgi:hypothetical protein
MPKRLDISGQRFGRLVAVEDAGALKGQRLWRCQCDCGSEHVVRLRALMGGHTRSCGCLNLEKILARNTTHGLTHSPEYRVWAAMLNRCKNSTNREFHRYGGRGIAVCDRWRSFAAFIGDMGRKPSDENTLDRIDNDGHYEPGNCRWATRTEQSRNTSQNHPFEIGGELKCFVDWCAQYGIPRQTVKSRLNRGLSIEQALGI